jgi:ABC-type branched-subunit amino acid transport system permease subunit
MVRALQNQKYSTGGRDTNEGELIGGAVVFLNKKWVKKVNPFTGDFLMHEYVVLKKVVP